MRHHAHLQLLRQPPLRLHFHVFAGVETEKPSWTEEADAALSEFADRLTEWARTGAVDADGEDLDRLAAEYHNTSSPAYVRALRELESGRSVLVGVDPGEHEPGIDAEIQACRDLDCMRYCPDRGCATAVSITDPDTRCWVCGRHLVSWDRCKWIDYTAADARKAIYDCLCSLASDHSDFLPSMQHAQIIFAAWTDPEECPVLDRWAHGRRGVECDDIEVAVSEAEKMFGRLMLDRYSWRHGGEPEPQIAAVAAALRCLRSRLGDALVDTLTASARRDRRSNSWRMYVGLASAAAAAVPAGLLFSGLAEFPPGVPALPLAMSCAVYAGVTAADTAVAFRRRRDTARTLRDLARPRRRLGVRPAGSAI
ncbi:hypothetical protein [Nocardia blacklockiae]|uniref:hypothetical protein n=1 Tax=Nocardia blacklockiae TaxID=480036 RepID=UPI00189412EA|nr:hypothetical protein [Nocardia blacklockiae]MBF6171099.1 hypothetical protein [Nocardia blacklockiae]